MNCFGFGGSNAHTIVDQPSKAQRRSHISSYRDEDEEEEYAGDDTTEDVPPLARPYILVLSANDAVALKGNVSALCSHVAKLGVHAPVLDLAYTLSERRSRLWHRAFVTTDIAENLDESSFILGKKTSQTPKIGLIFTGQGAQWPQMGKDLLATFPQTREILQELDDVLQSQLHPPAWSLEAELTESRSAEHLRQPEFSQPLVTALQICILSLLRSWGVKPSAGVMGHSSGEIAAAYAAGFLDRASAIKAAFYRGRAAVNCNRKADSNSDLGMLAVGLGADKAEPFLANHSNIWIACFNSPSSITVSGQRKALEDLAEDIKAAGHFARLLQVDLAYHSPLMGVIGDEYGRLLKEDQRFKPVSTEEQDSSLNMYSSVTESKQAMPTDAEYWTSNMVSAVRFEKALKNLVISEEPDILVEIGPSGALAGPIAQTLKDESLASSGNVKYHSSWARGSGAVKALLDVAGHLFVAGAPIDLASVNGGYLSQRAIVDLPNYQWNHTARYWHENATSFEWRNKRYITHDLLGSKIPGTSWKAPTWRKKLSLADVSWLRDHQMGPDILVPGMAFIAMALEAIYQKHCVLHPEETKGVKIPADLAYRFRNVKFDRAVVVEEGKPTTLLLTLASVPGSNEWHEFRVRTTAVEDQEIIYEHCKGLVRVQEALGDDHALHGDEIAPLNHPQSAEPWYKLQDEMGSHFGPSFRRIKQWETVSGQRTCRATLSMEPPPSSWNPQSSYPIHPATLDVCQQTATAAFLAGERSTLKDVIILSHIDDMVINRVPHQLKDGLSVAEAVWTGRGREELVDSWSTNVSIHDPDTGGLFVRFRGLNYVRLDVEQKPDPHVFNAIRWKPDITYVSQDQLLFMKTDETTLIDEVVDLIAHKTPRLSVLEISLDDTDPAEASSLWIQSANAISQSVRAASSNYTFAAIDAQVQVAVEAANAGRASNIKFQLLIQSQDDLGLPALSSAYDLAIIRASSNSDVEVDQILAKLKGTLKPDAFTLVIKASPSASANNSPPPSNFASGFISETVSEGDDNDSDSPSASHSSAATTVDLDVKPAPHDSVSQRLWYEHSDEGANILQIPGASRARLYVNNSSNNNIGSVARQDKGEVLVARFSNTIPPLAPTLRRRIEASGYSVSEKTVEELGLESTALASVSAVLVMDELVKPLLTDVSADDWNGLKKLVSSGRPVLWITKGAQTDRVTEPENAMVQGLFRVARREDPGVRLTTLDVQNPASPDAHWAIERVLRIVLANGTEIEDEYAERDGMLLIPRIMVDDSLNKFKRADIGAGLEPVVKELHSNEAQVRFQAHKKGSLDNLAWCETAVGEVPVESGKVDIQVMAMGVNFKDVATTMGLVPENEQLIGCECAGYVRRVGSNVTGLRVGDRVVAQTNGTYVNHLQVVPDRLHPIPDSMSFEEAATIPLVYLTTIYSLYHLGNLQEGQVRRLSPV